MAALNTLAPRLDAALRVEATALRQQQAPASVRSSNSSLASPWLGSASQLTTSSSQETSSSRRSFAVNAKRMFDDPFNYGEDPDMEYGDLLASGKQDAVEPRPPTDKTSTRGWLNFPAGHNPEIASLGLYVRGDVRSCIVMVAGGVYENLLFFPLIQLLKDKYPGVKIDVAASARGKQTYEVNKNVRRAWVYDVEDPFIPPGEYTEFLGKMKNECYDLVLSTRMSGMGHAMFLFLTDARQKVAYVIPNAYGAGAGVFLSTAIRAERMNLADKGYYMYTELADWLLNPVRGGPPLTFPPLRFNIPRIVRAAARERYEAAGASAGKYTLVHGIESTSAASMRSAGDADSQLPVSLLPQIAKDISGDVLVVIPNEKDRAKVAAALPSAKIVLITTPGQLAAAIDDAAGVVTTNTAAVQLATSLQKPSVALFGSIEKAELFVPDAKDKKCAVVASKTGELAGLDAKVLSIALSTLPSAAVPSAA